MGTVVSEFPGPVAAVFLLAENRLLREALLRILSKKDDIRVVGSESYEPDMFEHIVTSRANVVVLDSVTPVLAEQGVARALHQLNPAIRVVMVGMEADETIFLRVVQAGVLGYVLKDASAVEGARTIRAVAAGEAVCPATLSVALFQWESRHKPAIPHSHLQTSLARRRNEPTLQRLSHEGL